MRQTKIVTDSGCDIPQELVKSMNVDVVPLNLQLGDRCYVDDANLDVASYITDMERCPIAAKTAAPSPEAYMQSYREGDVVYAVTLSSHLSGSYNSAVLAKELYKEEVGQKFIHVVDSLSASVGELLVALKIDELSAELLSDTEIVERITAFVDRMKTYFILEKYDNLVKTGRMSPAIAKLASFLNIKPICMAKKGKIEMADKARGYKRAVTKLVDIIQKDKNVDYSNRILGVSHVGCREKAEALRDEILARIHFKDAIVVEASGLCSTYAHRDGIIIAY